MRDKFNDYEAQAVKVMTLYGGRLIAAVEVKNSNHDVPPNEIHLLEFPDQTAFNAYRNSAELQQLSEIRAQCITRTALQFGHANAPLMSMLK